jgi:hypothetical protein
MDDTGRVRLGERISNLDRIFQGFTKTHSASRNQTGEHLPSGYTFVSGLCDEVLKVVTSMNLSTKRTTLMKVSKRTSLTKISRKAASMERRKISGTKVTS